VPTRFVDAPSGKSTRLARLRSLLFALLFSSATLFAQTITTGDITGTVKDLSGAIVPGAAVSLKSLGTGETRTDSTNSNGVYRFATLRPGHYEVSAKTSGLQSDDLKVDIGVGEVAKVDILAKVQSTSQTVEVTDSANLVNTDNANLTTEFSTKQINELPMPGGDLTTVAFTVPGIAVSTGGGYGNFSSHGLPGTSNLYTINGNDYNDAYLNLNNSGASNLLLGANEIEEASVTQNGYSVQYGRQAGAQVNYVTKGGTNDLHASLTFNFNNHLMNANDFFANEGGTPRPYDVSKQWGASIGGRIIKNKLFFFSDSEGIYYTLPSVGTVVIPSAQLQTYILGQLNPTQASLYGKAFAIWNGAKGAQNAVPVTNGSGILQDGNGFLGCGSVFAGTPAPNGGIFGSTVSCANAFQTSGSNTNKEWLETHRVDWNINDKQKIYFRFKGDHGFQPTGTNLLNSTLNEQSVQPQYEGQINHSYVISPSMVNNVVASVLWYSAIFGPASTSAASSLFPTYFSIGGDAGTNSGGFYPMGVNWNSFPQGRDVGQFQLTDDFSWNKGNHTLKFGENFRKNRVTDFSYESNQIGTYSFANLADFANGVTNSSATNGTSYYAQKFSPLQDAHIRLYNIGIYAQDEWAIKPNLKLTYGIRLDRTGNPTCLDKCFSNLDSSFTSTTPSGINTPYNASITSGGSHAYYKVPSIVPDPRVGVVWSPNDAHGLVVRTGVGIFSDLSPAFLVSNVFNNAPYPYNATIYDGSKVDTINDPASAPATALAQYNAFKSGFFGGQTLAQLQAALPTFNPFNYFSIQPEFKAPTYVEWSFEIEQPIGKKNAIIATYSGNHGYDLLIQNGFANASSSAGFAGLPLVSPDPRFGIVTQLENKGISNYDGLTIQYKRSLTYGLQGQINYTWSHALDDISNNGAGEPYSFCSGCSLSVLANPNLRANYGASDYDIRHSVTGDMIWDLPFKFGDHKLLNNLLGNWTIADKLYLRSGTPFSIIDSLLSSTLVTGSGVPTVNATMLASSVSGGLPGSCGVGAVNTACYSLSQFAAAGTETGFGNLGRNTLYGPHYFSTDISLFKNFNITERIRMQIGANAYNALNHPNFQNPNADVNGGGFGQITSTAIPPTSAYGAFQGSAVSGRVLVLTGRFTF
jgi:hypothetical protein